MIERPRTYEAGTAEGRIQTLLRLICQRFGEPHDDVVARIRAGTTFEIDCWLDTILDAETLENLLAAPATPAATERHRPFLIRRDGAVFELQRIRDEDLRLLLRDAAAIEDDFAYGLLRGAARREVRPLSLPEYLTGLSLRFGRSGRFFDDYKSSFAFPFRLTTTKGVARGNYVLLIEDWKGGPNSRLWRCSSERRTGLRTFHPFVDAEFSCDDYHYVLSYLEGFVQGYLETAKPVVHDYVHAVRAALLLYGYRDGKPFEHHAEDADDFAAVARNASRRDSRS